MSRLVAETVWMSHGHWRNSSQLHLSSVIFWTEQSEFPCMLWSPSTVLLPEPALDCHSHRYCNCAVKEWTNDLLALNFLEYSAFLWFHWNQRNYWIYTKDLDSPLRLTDPSTPQLSNHEICGSFPTVGEHRQWRLTAHWRPGQVPEQPSFQITLPKEKSLGLLWTMTPFKTGSTTKTGKKALFCWIIESKMLKSKNPNFTHTDFYHNAKFT